jgi:hypothetical protein
MKTLHLVMSSFLLVMTLFPLTTILAQNEIFPKIEFDNAGYFTKKMSCNFYNTGKISAQDQEQKKATIIVTDPGANKFSTSIDRVTVHVWSDSDKKGIEITAYETEVNSGIFNGTVTISEGQSTQDVIHVADGDTLSAKYTATTSLSLNATSHDVITTAFIGMSCPPLERVPASSLRILDDKGKEHHVIKVDQQVLITSDIANPTIANQTFTYIVQIQDKNGSTASLAWLSGKMLPKQAFSPSVSWTPSRAGNYVVNVFVWQSLSNPNALSPPLYTDLSVLHDFASYRESTTSNVENLHCELGHELVIKSSNNSTACVTPQSAQKLVERGWAKKIPTQLNLNSNKIVDVVAIRSVGPVNPGGPVIQLTLKNIGLIPITSLNATLELNNRYTFDFKDITESKPLAPGKSASDTEILIGAGSTELAYPLTINGIENNVSFRYTENIHIHQ